MDISIVNNVLKSNYQKYNFKVGDAIALIYENRSGFWTTRRIVGICIAITGSGVNKRCVLRNVISGIGVEFSFYLYNSRIIGIERLPVQKFKAVRKAKLYYLRNKNLIRSRV